MNLQRVKNLMRIDENCSGNVSPTSEAKEQRAHFLQQYTVSPQPNLAVVRENDTRASFNMSRNISLQEHASQESPRGPSERDGSRIVVAQVDVKVTPLRSRQCSRASPTDERRASSSKLDARRSASITFMQPDCGKAAVVVPGTASDQNLTQTVDHLGSFI